MLQKRLIFFIKLNLQNNSINGFLIFFSVLLQWTVGFKITNSTSPLVLIPLRELWNGDKIPCYGVIIREKNKVKDATYRQVLNGHRLLISTIAQTSEKSIGTALRACLTEGWVKREELFIGSQLWNTFHSVKYMDKAISDALNNLGVSYLDLYTIAWPMAFKIGINPYRTADYIEDDTPIEKTWVGMEDLVRLNYTRHIGLANFNLTQIKRIMKVAKIQPSVVMVECNPYMIPEDIIEYCTKHNIVVMSSRPIYYSGAYPSMIHNLDMITEPIISKIASKYNTTTIQIILRYLLDLGTIPLHHMITRAPVYDPKLFSFTLTKQEINQIKGLNYHIRSIRIDQCLWYREYPFPELREIYPNRC